MFLKKVSACIPEKKNSALIIADFSSAVNYGSAKAVSGSIALVSELILVTPLSLGVILVYFISNSYLKNFV